MFLSNYLTPPSSDPSAGLVFTLESRRMLDVHDEIVWEILSWLPVAPLLRFRCVSKSWKGMIDSDQFIKHHLTHSRKANSNINIVVFGDNQLHSADLDLLGETNMATFKQLSHPLKTTSGLTQVLGSGDGLLLLRYQKDDITILWNPSIERFHVIPSTGIESAGYFKVTYYGFGYDVLSDDIKLIRITQFYGKDDEYNSEVKVYSLKSGSWRRIPDFPYHIDCEPNEVVLANGALHFTVSGKVKPDSDNLVAGTEEYRLMKSNSENLVAAFDLGTEEYRLVPLPKLARDNCTCMCVVELGGQLSVMCYYNEDRVDIWVMKEYGVQESWSVLFTLDSRFEFMTPLAYSKCGRKVLLGLEEKVLTWYDLDKKSTNEPMLQMPLEDFDDAYTCLPSLLLLNNGTRDFDLVTKKKQESGHIRWYDIP